MSKRAHPALAGKTAVVTGAARGLGRLLALRLAQEGVRCLLVGLEPEELDAVAAECGAGAAAFEADVTDARALHAVADEAEERFGGVDIVVANAGIATGGPFADTPAPAFDRVIEVNLLGSIATARAFLPALRRRRGYLLQVASLAALAPAPLMGAYCAGKAGVEAFAHCLAPEVAAEGVGVGVAYLSWTDTDMVRGADEDAALAQMRRRLPWPMNRTYAPEPAVERLLEGIARRRAHVYGQPWLRAVQGVRGALPALIGAFAPREIARLRTELEATRDRRAAAVGAGGAADMRARAGRGG
ncbi:SDR family NAD(P)-dependent oxidoreductase [Streptomonospora sp. PA3]|uniref:short-chain dehydrogenase/reductase n=1 Tax=Streptomonospora sp. PA3 TaxID=2607326 RepID=UPI0012DFBFC0|nr:short-chain dehydrogenase/reductase [Streptomonospora sp. PA3]MUL40574.1 SDR family NAD(P)-dependent oxidoreductase [Streptomonospora sp. PA3]